MRLASGRKLIAFAGASVGLVLLLCAAGAIAGHGGPPRTVLQTGGHHQRGGLVFEEWTARSGGGCVAQSGDGDSAYPEPIALKPGSHRASFVLRRRQRPSAVKITAWHMLDPDGQEAGTSEVLPRTLESRRDSSGRITAWVAKFRVNVPPTYYMRLYARWPDNDRCGGPRHVLRTYALGATG